MKRFLCLLLASFLISSTVISQSSQESPELSEATELTKSAVKLYRENKFDEALPLARRALEIRERLLPSTDLRVATSLKNLGEVYLAKHDYDSARKTFERLLKMQEEQFGVTHVNLASTLDRLAVLYYKDGKAAKAEELYQRALAAREKTFGLEAVQVADTLYAMGQLYRLRGDHDHALASYKRSLLIYGRSTGADSAEFKRAINGLSCLGHESQKKAIFNELEEIQKQFAPGPPPPPPAQLLNGYAVHLAKPDYPPQARERQLSGTVVVHVEIDERGKVISAKDMCDGLPYLTQSAIKAALNSQFTPTQIAGVPVKAKGVVRYNFVYHGRVWR